MAMAVLEQIANFFAHLSWTKHVFFLRFLWRDTFQLSFFTSVNSGCTTNLNDIVEFQGKYVAFHEQQECVYDFPSLSLATRALADMSESVFKQEWRSHECLKKMYNYEYPKKGTF